jgi:hypothetical protein
MINQITWISLNDAIASFKSKCNDDQTVWLEIRHKIGTYDIKTFADYCQYTYIDGESDIEQCQEVPQNVWRQLSISKLVNASSGHVEVSGWMSETDEPVQVKIIGLKLDAIAIARMANPKAALGGFRFGGRPPHPSWPQISEELTLHFYDEGYPHPSDTISSVVKKVLDRLAKRGVDTPDPETIRPVVKYVMERMRLPNP